jgi:hypothetical protein
LNFCSKERTLLVTPSKIERWNLRSLTALYKEESLDKRDISKLFSFENIFTLVVSASLLQEATIVFKNTNNGRIKVIFFIFIIQNGTNIYKMVNKNNS